MANIAIIGAGLVGRLLALLLVKQDENIVSRVSLYEKNELLSPDSTGLIAAAMVAPVAESVTASAHIIAMGQCSLVLWPKLLSCLAIKDAWWQIGTIVLAHPQDQSNLDHFKQRLKRTVRESVVDISAASLAALEPELADKFQQGLWLSQEGHVENHTLYQQSAQSILNSDINLFEKTAANIKGNTLCFSNAEPQTFDWVIDCRGLGAAQQLINATTSLRGVRGEVIRVRAPQVTLLHPVRVMHPRYPLYIVPKGNNQYVIGATEIESGSEQAISVRSALELLSAAYSVHSGFAEAEIVAIQTGLRPTLLDNEPSITVKNQVIQINGLYRHGYLLVPYILEQILLLLRSLEGLKADKWQIFSDKTCEIDNTLITHFSGKES